MKITITTTQQVEACRQSWDNFLPEKHHLCSNHLQAFENAGIENIRNHYVRVFSKDKLIGLVYLQQFCIEHKHIQFSNQSALHAKLLNCFIPKKMPILVCGHLFRINFEGFYFREPAQQATLFDAIELFLKQQHYRPLGIMIKDCAAGFIEQQCRLSGYRFFNGDVTMEITRRANWVCFDDYLNDLAKDYRQRARKIVQRFEGIDCRELQAEEILAESVAIEQLYWNVVNKQSIRLGTVNTAYFYELKKDLGAAFEFHALYKNEKMVGFYTFIFYERTMETHFIGLDYDLNKIHNLYFNILFLSIRKMIGKGFDALELGRTGREAKANAGAFPRQVFNYIKVKNSLVRILINYFLKRFNQAADHNLVKRTVFK